MPPSWCSAIVWARRESGVHLFFRRIFLTMPLNQPEANPASDRLPHIVSVSLDARHGFTKWPVPMITLLAGQGVSGDAHAGITVQHRSRVAANPHQPNLRQVHLIHAELLDELRAAGFRVDPGTLGENVTTRGLDVLALPQGTRLTLGKSAVIEITGLRDPCRQLDGYQRGLTAAVLDHDANGELIRKCGVMAIVIKGGDVFEDDLIKVKLPRPPHQPLKPV